MLIALLDVGDTNNAIVSSGDLSSRKPSGNEVNASTKGQKLSSKSTKLAQTKASGKSSTSETSPVSTFQISESDSYSSVSKTSSTPNQTNARIIDSSKVPAASLSIKRRRTSANTIDPSPQVFSSSSSESTATSASRLVVNTPETTQFALHSLTEYSEFNNVFKNQNAKKNVQQFHAYIQDIGKFYNTTNTPMREMAAKKLTKIEDTAAIRNTFGVEIGVHIVNAVRDIILLQIPKIVSKYKLRVFQKIKSY